MTPSVYWLGKMMVIWRSRSAPTSLRALRMSASSSMKSSGHGGTPKAPWLRNTSRNLQRIPASESFFLTCLTSGPSEGENNIFITNDNVIFLYNRSGNDLLQYGEELKKNPGVAREKQRAGKANRRGEW